MYSQVNIEPIGTLTDLQNRTSHCLRRGGADATFRGSYRPEDEHKNEHFILGEDGTLEATTDGFNLNAEIEKMRAANGASYRKNAPVATEFILGASKEFFEGKNEQQIKEWAQVSMRAAEAKFEGKVFAASLHMDESTPHLHVYILPHYQKPLIERKKKENARKRKSRRKPRVGVSHEKVIGRYGQYHDWYNSAMHAAGYTALKRGEPMDKSGKKYGELKRRLELEEEALIEKKHAVDMRDEAAHSFFERNIDEELALKSKKREFREEIVRRTNEERTISKENERKSNELAEFEKQLQKQAKKLKEQEIKQNQKDERLTSRIALFKSKIEHFEGVISRTLAWVGLNKDHLPANWLTENKDEIANLEDDLKILRELRAQQEVEDDENDKPQGLSF